MKFVDFLLGIMVYAICLAAGSFIIFEFKLIQSEWVFIICAIICCFFIAFRYHRRDLAPARFVVKATTGVYLALLSGFAAYQTQSYWRWLDLPEYVYALSALGAYLLPFFLFNGVQHLALHHRD